MVLLVIQNISNKMGLSNYYTFSSAKSVTLITPYFVVTNHQGKTLTTIGSRTHYTMG
jgi:hypothetical protein